MRRLFFKTGRGALRVEADDAITLWIFDAITKHGCPVAPKRCAIEKRLQVVAVENVIAQCQRDIALADKPPTDQKCLRDTFGARICIAYSNFTPQSSFRCRAGA